VVNGKRRRLMILTVAVACAGAAVGTAFALAANTSSDPLTRNEVFKEGMSLQEIAAAATGQPGEIAPPCPDVATATRLKEEGIPFGPCDLLPEEGAPVRIADSQSEPKPDDDVICPGIVHKVGIRVELPCRPGAKIVESEIVEVDGRFCARVTYVPETGSPPRTETLCEGDRPAVGGEPVSGPPTTDRE
jgi:hypothetical protein